MKRGFYLKLAIQAMKKNRRMYVPFILASVGTIAVNYIIAFLATADIVLHMHGGDLMAAMMGFGLFVMAVFGLAILLDASAMLFKSRKNELGLYNVLGMNKGNLSLLVFVEIAISALISMAGGLALGIIFSKLAELALFRLVHQAVISYSLSISVKAILETLVVFTAIFVLVYFNGIRQVRRVNTVQLLQGTRSGEKPPKGNVIIAILGLAILIGAYFIAVTITNPVSALGMFFIAVIMVIIATYMLFISGSVFFCRILKKNKKFYYSSKHFTSVSNMAYRMKRNGSSLAGICILATMVLVMLAGSASLFYGAEDAIDSMYPYDISVAMSLEEDDASGQAITNIPPRVMGDVAIALNDCVNQNGYSDITETGFAALYESLYNIDEEGNCRASDNYASAGKDCWFTEFITASNFENMMGEKVDVEPGNAVVKMFRGTCDFEELTLPNGSHFTISERSKGGLEYLKSVTHLVNTMTVIINDADEDKICYNSLYGKINFKDASNVSVEAQSELAKNLYVAGEEAFTAAGYGEELVYNQMAAKEDYRKEFYGAYGGIFFLGIMLSIVFIFATTLIIYYKQVTEGYEDRHSFDIMQKVGMTDEEIRSSIDSQILMVFFIPLVAAVIHLCFAFPMIQKLLVLFSIFNLQLLLIVTGIAIVVFAILYVIIYKVTSNTYYKIVRGM